MDGGYDVVIAFTGENVSRILAAGRRSPEADAAAGGVDPGVAVAEQAWSAGFDAVDPEDPWNEPPAAGAARELEIDPCPRRGGPDGRAVGSGQVEISARPVLTPSAGDRPRPRHVVSGEVGADRVARSVASLGGTR